MATKVFFICGFPLLRSKPDAPSRPKKCKEISDRHPMGNDARLVAVPSSAHRSAMTMTRIVSLILALFCIAAQPPRAEEADARKPVTLLISIAGFRAAYLDRGMTPDIPRLPARGRPRPRPPHSPHTTPPHP